MTKQTVTRNGVTYKVKSNATVIPDFDEMTPIEVSLWMLRNTYPRGYRARPSGIEGMGSALSVSIK
jgi:hypothetical protein